jgi:hypothetical protein
MQQTFVKIVNDNSSKGKLARIVSDIISPPLVYAVMGFVFSWYELSFWDGLIWGVLYGFLISFIPVLTVWYSYRIGKVQDMHISKTEQRRTPYLLSIVGALIIIIVILVLDGPKLLLTLAVCNLIGLTILFLINFCWLISSHMASISMATLLLTINFGYLVGMFTIPFVLLVYWSRIELKRHSAMQMLAGLIVAILAVFGYLTLLGSTAFLQL